MANSTGFYNSEGKEITRAAFFSLKSAAMIKQIGRYAALAYCIKNGGSLRLFTLARQLQAMDKINLTA